METAYIASGCFWGTQYFMSRLAGVRETFVGFMGGSVENPTYKEVKTGETGHIETVKVLFDPAETSYEEVLKMYFETHDFTQTDGQGIDIGSQYLSAIFYLSDEQRATAEALIAELTAMGYAVATQLRPAENFWMAEDYHQNYLDLRKETPECHVYKAVFRKK